MSALIKCQETPLDIGNMDRHGTCYHQGRLEDSQAGPLRGQRVPVRRLVTRILREWDMEALATG